MKDPIRILCVDDEPNVLRSLQRIFLDEDYEILTAASGEEGLEILDREQDIQLVISDYRMPGLNGVDFLRQVCEKCPETLRIVLSGYADTAAVVGAINDGQIYKFIPKPWNDEELKRTIGDALEKYVLRKKNARLMEELSASNDELTLINENLEAMVAERTTDLLLRNQALTIAQNILDALPVAVLGLDASGLIVCGNEEAQEMFHGSSDFLLGCEAGEVLPEEVLHMVDDLTKANRLCCRVDWQGRRLRVKGTRMLDDDQEGIVLVLEEEGSIG